MINQAIMAKATLRGMIAMPLQTTRRGLNIHKRVALSRPIPESWELA